MGKLDIREERPTLCQITWWSTIGLEFLQTIIPWSIVLTSNRLAVWLWLWVSWNSFFFPAYSIILCDTPCEYFWTQEADWCHVPYFLGDCSLSPSLPPPHPLLPSLPTAVLLTLPSPSPFTPSSQLSFFSHLSSPPLSLLLHHRTSLSSVETHWSSSVPQKTRTGTRQRDMTV